MPFSPRSRARPPAQWATRMRHALLRGLVHRADDLAVVEHHAVADANRAEHLGQCAAHQRRLDRHAMLVAHRLVPRAVAQHEVEQVARRERDASRLRRDRADGTAQQALAATPQRELDAGLHVRGGIRRAHERATRGLADGERALAPAVVGEFDRVACACAADERRVHRQGAGRRVAGRGGGEDHGGRLDHRSVGVATRVPTRRGGTGRDRVGAQLGPGEVERDQATHAVPARGGADVAHHRRPGRRVVVGAVDACDLHAVADQVGDQRRVGGRLRRQRHHDPGRPVPRRRSQDGDRVLGQHRAPGVEVDRRRLAHLGRHRRAA